MYKLLPLTNSDFGLPAVLIKFTETFKSIAVSLTSGRPSTWNQIYQNAVYNFFRSDHYRFWNAEPSLPAVFLTDSADFRGYMVQCYHKDCDDMSQVTQEMVMFLGRTSASMVELATSMTNEACQMKKTGRVNIVFRPRVVSLSLSPSSKTENKQRGKKWPREILGCAKRDYL